MAKGCRPGIGRLGRPRLEAPLVRAHGSPPSSGENLKPLRCAIPKTPTVTALAIQVPNDVEEPRRAEPPGRSGHAVSLAIKDERRVLAVAEQMVARHIPGLK